MGRGKSKLIRAALLASVAALGATGVVAQNTAVTGDLTLTTTVSADTNPGLAAFSAGTVLDFSENLAFSASTETSTQLLEIFGSAGLAFSQTVGGGNTFAFTAPNITVHYLREAADSNLDVQANYWSGDVTSAFDIDPSNAVFLIVDVGTLDRVGATVAYNWGLNAPLGFSISASFDQDDYGGTTDPALFDTTTSVLTASANMRISPTTQGTFTVVRTDYTSSDAFLTSSLTMQYGLQISHELARGLTIDGNIAFREKSTTSSGNTSTTSGLLAGVDLNQALADGSVFGSLQFDGSRAVASTALMVGRSLDLPTGTLSGQVSADKNAGSSAQFLASADYTQQLPDGSVSVAFSQTLFTDTLNQDVKYSTLGIGYQQTLNSFSTLNLTLDWRRTEDTGTGMAATLNRSSLSAIYSRTLTADWDLSVGYSHLENSGSAIATARSDKVFLTLTRDIQFGF